MSQYVPVGITDMDLEFKAPSSSGSSSGGSSPLNALFDFVAKTGLNIENALTSPAVQEFMQKAGIKAEEVRVEEYRRKQKSNLLLWGGVAAGVLFLAVRKSK